MAAIKGIFEPFYKYVQRQLNIRRLIISDIQDTGENSFSGDDTLRLNSENFIVDNEFMDIKFDGNSEDFENNINEGRLIKSSDGLPFMGNLRRSGIGPNSQISIVTKDNNNNEKILVADPSSFFKYTTERQCTIRMASGVDIKRDNELLYKNEKSGIESWTNGQQTAKNWILVGTNDPYYAEDLRNNYIMPPDNSRYTEKFGTYSNEVINVDWKDALNTSKGGSVPIGSKSENIGGLRNEAKDGFGYVPNPGIVDATIATKSEDGSLREATVNFICHNRGQLEVLEALYMRPGYPILLDWGWFPYLNNDMKMISNDKLFNIDNFFNPSSTLEQINETIRNNKELSGGNYDGFVGYCKNFSFKVREDGGYNCTTEIIAQAEMLASLKASTRMVPRILNYEDISQIYTPVSGSSSTTQYTPNGLDHSEVDEFLFYLYSIKATLDKAGDEIYMSSLGTERESTATLKGTWLDWDWLEDMYPQLFEEASIIDSEGNKIDITQLNIVDAVYQKGFKDILNLVSDVKKVSLKEVSDTFIGHYDMPDFLIDQQNPEYNQADDGMWQASYDNILGYGATRMEGYGDYVDENSVRNEVWKIKFGRSATEITARDHYLGFDNYCFGTIMKEIVLNDRTEEDSGIQSRVFLRWDLICQIFNLKVIPKYKKNTPISEITYLHSNEQAYNSKSTYDDNNNLVTIPFKKLTDWTTTVGAISYIEYSIPKPYSIYHDKEVNNTDHQLALGGSLDLNVCIMPHELHRFKSLTLNNSESKGSFPPSDPEFNTQLNKTGYDNLSVGSTNSINQNKASDLPFVSSRDFQFGERNNQIGGVLFNLDYLIKTYESATLENYTTNENNKDVTKRRTKDEFSLHEWITTIWNGVNEACGGFYDFGLHSEHERPHVARIIDFTFDKDSNGFTRPVYEFYPIGLSSIVRDFNIESKLDEDFASAISIAAQAPKNIHSLDSLSFKAFHKDIKNRFTDDSETEDMAKTIEEAKKDYMRLAEEYTNSIKALNSFKNRMYASNYESYVIKRDKLVLFKPASSESAKNLARGLESKRIELGSRYPEYTDTTETQPYDGSEAVGGHYTGEYKPEGTYSRNAIIPLTTSLTLDGIAGILPLNVFKINRNFLPLGYSNPNIAFVVKQESQKITSGQDWTTSLTGYLTLLNDNPNLGANTKPKVEVIPEEPVTTYLFGCEGGDKNYGKENAEVFLRMPYKKNGGTEDWVFNEKKINGKNYEEAIKLSDEDWAMLVKAVYAESGHSQNEYTYIMAVMLNRVRLNFGNYGKTLYQQLHARSQFQAVTGYKGNNYQPSPAFESGPPNPDNDGFNNLYYICLSTQDLVKVDPLIVNFTSNIPKAYIKWDKIDKQWKVRSGINWEFCCKMRENGTIVKQSVFGVPTTSKFDEKAFLGDDGSGNINSTNPRFNPNTEETYSKSMSQALGKLGVCKMKPSP
jgi:hypothetical protein